MADYRRESNTVLSRTGLQPLYPCDFCLKLMTECSLEKCANCTEIFCVWCVNRPKTVINIVDGEEQWEYYCSYVCYAESITRNQLATRR